MLELFNTNQQRTVQKNLTTLFILFFSCNFTFVFRNKSGWKKGCSGSNYDKLNFSIKPTLVEKVVADVVKIHLNSPACYQIKNTIWFRCKRPPLLVAELLL